MYVAIIPARGGSKTIKNKNLTKLKNKPLIYYTLNQTLKAKIFKKIIVTSDSKKIINYANTIKGIDVIKRPKLLSADKSKTEDAVYHACKKLKEQNIKFKYIFILEPTSPFRSLETIIKASKIITMKSIDSVITLTRNKNAKIQIKNNIIKKYDKQRRRQERKYNYFEASVLWAIKSEKFFNKRNLITKKTFGLLVNEVESIDINDHRDLEKAKLYEKYL